MHFRCGAFFLWALMLPLAVPAYVLAFTQLGLFRLHRRHQHLAANAYGIEQALPEVRNGFGLVLVMSLTFYPYVYLLARNAFASMGQRALEAGASLGLSPARAFVKVALPMARPWIAGGVILALMETLADFGTVSVFGYHTFTTAIYQAWFRLSRSKPPSSWQHFWSPRVFAAAGAGAAQPRPAPLSSGRQGAAATAQSAERPHEMAGHGLLRPDSGGGIFYSAAAIIVVGLR